MDAWDGATDATDGDGFVAAFGTGGGGGIVAKVGTLGVGVVGVAMESVDAAGKVASALCTVNGSRPSKLRTVSLSA